MRLLFSLLFLFSFSSIKAQDIYTKAFGNPQGKPLIFLHGGPGGSAFDKHHIESIKSLVVNENHFAYLDNCSHGVFMDQQEKFIQLLNLWLN